MMNEPVQGAANRRAALTHRFEEPVMTHTDNHGICVLRQDIGGVAAASARGRMSQNKATQVPAQNRGPTAFSPMVAP